MGSTGWVVAATAVLILAVAAAVWLPAFLSVRRRRLPPPDVPTFRRWPDSK